MATQPYGPMVQAPSNPIRDLSKALFDNESARNMVKNGYIDDGFSVKANMSADLLKALLSSGATIQAGPLSVPLQVRTQPLDTMYVLPIDTEIYRQRRPKVGVAEPVMAGNDIPESSVGNDTDFTPVDVPLRTIAVKQRISKRAYVSMGSDASRQGLADILMRDVRRALQVQVLAGSGSDPDLQSINGQLDAAQRTAIRAPARGGEGTPILETVEDAVSDLIEAGAEPSYIFANARDAKLLWRAQVGRKSAFVVSRDLPYGAPLGAGIVVAPQLPQNTLIVASTGDPRFHLLPTMGFIQVDTTDVGEVFATDEVMIRARIYVQSVVQAPGAFRVFTGTNNFVQDPVS